MLAQPTHSPGTLLPFPLADAALTYWMDTIQRCMLFADTLRERGNVYQRQAASKVPQRPQLQGRARRRRPHAGAARQLRAGPDHAAGGRRRSTAASGPSSSSIRAPAMGPASAA